MAMPIEAPIVHLGEVKALRAALHELPELHHAAPHLGEALLHAHEAVRRGEKERWAEEERRTRV